ncbi:RNA-binding protein 33 isoform X2 [Hyla sarda]|uniref:RNA-binding protein 33 isoform X2 n=1 Tax=Hyla sarda TaxID=327740 RepID=UPI0024C31E84|nr:RNA-binding protein 33 isoform X2 [Hyla sarda]
MAAMLEDDDFDQFDKPGAERSRRRRTKDDDWDSELEDDLLEEDFLPGKKTSLDLSDEELNDDLLQSDEEELDLANYSSQGVTVSLNATTGGLSSFDLSKSINEENVAEEAEFEEETEEIYEETEELETGTEDVGQAYEESYEVADEHVEYEEEETTDEVLDLEINEPLDEFQDEEYSQSFKRQKTSEEQPLYVEDTAEEHYMEDTAEEQYVEDTAEEQYAEDTIEDVQEQESQELVNESEEVVHDSQELPSQTKESFDEDDEDEEEEESGRLRFKTERKEGTIIRLSDTNRERRNIPETLELSEEAKASLMEFEEMERQRKMGHYGARRGGRRGGNHGMHRGMRDQRNDHDRRNMRERHNQGQPVRSLFQQQQHQHIQPLLPMPRSRNLSSSNGQQSPRLEKSRMGNNTLLATPQQQPKNIHINPHFKGNVAPVQVPLLPVPNQSRPPMGPPRFPGMPEFQPPSSPVPGNFNQPPRLQEPWRNPPPPPPPQPEREPFFMGEPRFPNHHIFDQRNPPPGPPPPLMNTNHPVPNQNVPPFNPPGQGFNQLPRFNQPPPGPQPGFNPPGPQGGFNQPGFNQPGPQSGFNPPGPQPVFNPSGNQPGFNPPNFGQPGPQPGFNQSGPPPPFNPPGPNQPGFNQLNPGPQPGFNQPGSGLPHNFPQPSPGPQPAFNTPGFSRERPVRMNMPSPNPLGMPPFNQPSGNIRPFAPPRQQFPSGPGQPFMPHSQSNMQGNMQLPIQPLHQHHHHGGPPKPLGSTQQPSPFRAQTPQTHSHRMSGQQRHGPPKPRQGTSGQNMAKVHNPQALHQRNSNLRELPIAPSNPAADMNKRRAAQVKPLGTATPQAKPENVGVTQASKSLSTPSQVKQEPKVEEQFPEEDEETRKYRLKIEEQKRLREEILRQKELRRQQQAGARKKELLERLSQQQQMPNTAQQAPLEADKQTVKVENSSNPIMTHVTEQPRPNVKNRLVAKKSDSLVTMTPQKIPLLQSAGPSASKQGLQKKGIRQNLPNRVTVENQSGNMQPVRPAGTATPFGQQQTLKIASVQGRPQEQRPTGAKRTVMQRSNSNSGDQAHLATKVRVIKMSGPGENVAVQATESSPQVHISQTRVHPQQRISPQQRQQYQQRMQQKTGPVRKVTLGKGSVQQQQNLPYQQQYQVNTRPLTSLTESASPQVVNSIHGLHPPNKVIMRGRGRGASGQMGRGRPMPNKQNLRVVECKPQPCVVSVEGLSSSTNEHQLRNLLMSVGPIQHVILEQQRQITVQRNRLAAHGDCPDLVKRRSCRTNVFVTLHYE